MSVLVQRSSPWKERCLYTDTLLIIRSIDVITATRILYWPWSQQRAYNTRTTAFVVCCSILFAEFPALLYTCLDKTVVTSLTEQYELAMHKKRFDKIN